MSFMLLFQPLIVFLIFSNFKNREGINLMNPRITRKEFMKYAKFNGALLHLEQRIKEHSKENKDNADYCANAPWYREFKKEVCALVGWSAIVPELRNSQAYDAVYDYLYHLLPDCRHDGMC
jgi:hypothetical protein